MLTFSFRDRLDIRRFNPKAKCFEVLVKGLTEVTTIRKPYYLPWIPFMVTLCLQA